MRDLLQEVFPHDLFLSCFHMSLQQLELLSTLTATLVRVVPQPKVVVVLTVWFT